MITIKNCTTELWNDGRVAWIQLPSNPDYEIMIKLGRGKPVHNTITLATSYELNGITYYLHR